MLYQAHTKGYLAASPSKRKVANQAPMQVIPLVMEPKVREERRGEERSGGLIIVMGNYVRSGWKEEEEGGEEIDRYVGRR